MQAINRPGDIVLLAHDCHKSHPYAVILCGAHPVYLDAYPPGFPVLVPGQVIAREIVQYRMALDVKEIHGYEPAFGLRVFTANVVAMEDVRSNGICRTSPKCEFRKQCVIRTRRSPIAPVDMQGKRSQAGVWLICRPEAHPFASNDDRRMCLTASITA